MADREKLRRGRPGVPGHRRGGLFTAGALSPYVWRRTDRWIDFPWSSQPPVTPRP
jgi:hypothetical protein